LGQSDILDWLRQRRLSGDHSYFTRKEIEQAMSSKGLKAYNVRAQLNALYVYHYLDVDYDLDWPFNRRYRLKKKYCSAEEDL
jgi:hypothetical protein